MRTTDAFLRALPLGLAVLSLGSPAAAPSVLRPAETDRAIHVLLVTIDTLRADRLGAYGYDRIETPNIDGLARRGTLFGRAFSPVPLTLPAHASIMTGLYPPRHGVRDNGDFRLPDRETTLAEHLGSRGFSTIAVTCCAPFAPGSTLTMP